MIATDTAEKWIIFNTLAIDRPDDTLINDPDHDAPSSGWSHPRTR